MSEERDIVDRLEGRKMYAKAQHYFREHPMDERDAELLGLAIDEIKRLREETDILHAWLKDIVGGIEIPPYEFPIVTDYAANAMNEYRKAHMKGHRQ